MSWIAVLALGLALGCGGYTDQAAKPTVVVLSVKGKKAKRMTGDMVDVLRGQDYPLIARKTYDKAARKLRAKRIKTRNVRKVATEIGANAVITGRLKRRKGKYTLTVTVRDGKTGKRVDRFKLKLKRRKLSDDDRARLQDKLIASLSLIEPPAPDPGEDDGSNSKVATEDKKSKKKNKKSKKQKAREEKERLREELARRDEAKREKAARKKAEREEAERERESKKSKRDKKREKALAKKEKARERAEKKKAARERKKAERERKKAERERKKAEREKKKKADELPPVKLPSVGNDGQAIDDEMPGGL